MGPPRPTRPDSVSSAGSGISSPKPLAARKVQFTPQPRDADPLGTPRDDSLVLMDDGDLSDDNTSSVFLTQFDSTAVAARPAPSLSPAIAGASPAITGAGGAATALMSPASVAAAVGSAAASRAGHAVQSPGMCLLAVCSLLGWTSCCCMTVAV